MKKRAIFKKLDRYISGDDLDSSELKLVWTDPLLMFAYDCRSDREYMSVKVRMVIVQKTYGRFSNVKAVFYIIKHTNLSLWQKLKLRVLYLFG